MKKYQLVILPDAKEDLRRSLTWGIEHWGLEKAGIWLNEMYATFTEG